MKRALLLIAFLLYGCGETSDTGWTGYVEGEDAFIAAPQAGWVEQLSVKRGDIVKRGEILFRLDNTRQVAARAQTLANLAEAEAQIRQAEADLTLAKKELTRQGGLLRAHAGTQQNYDLAQSNAKQAAARLAQATALHQQYNAALADADYQLSQREVRAQTAGRVEDIYFRTGEYAPAMTPVVAVLPPQNIYVRFFVPETQFAKVHMGDKVSITCDGCAKPIPARITFIAQQEEFTPPVIFSAESRERLVFKLEARADGGLKLNPGQPVTVRPQ